MTTPDENAALEDAWDSLVSLAGNPPPDATLKSVAGGEDAGSWGSVFASSDPVTTPLGGMTGEDATSLGGGLDVRVSRVAMGPADVGGDYLITGELGRGGMGVVYNARQRSLDRNVAVKMIAPRIEGSAAARRKMVAEALVIGELDHPNIIPIHDLGRTEQNNLFYAMKIVKGTPWSSTIRANSLRDNLGILMRVADAAAFAHDKGVIHRDLKPGNVMLGGYGEVLVTDWGLAVDVGGASKAERLSPLNAMAGTPAYMAPEMARGEAASIGPRSDIYLLGAILYEIVTGARPHAGGSSRECLRAAAMNAITPAATDDDLLRVAFRAMAADPGERYATAKEFQAAIDEVEIHHESLAMTASAEERLASAVAGGEYGDFAQAVFAFREATRLWPGNARAVAGEAEAKRNYAECAFGKSDYDLALENMDGFVDDDSLAFIAKVRRARTAAQLRKKRVRWLTIAAGGLTAAVVVILAAATVVVTDRMNKEREARREARRALAETEAAREREGLASLEREAALRREKEAVVRERDAQTERLAALDRAEAERRGKEEADRARLALADEMSRKGQLEDASWWAFDADEARARQAGAGEAARIVVSFNGAGMAFAVIPAGEFVMGSSPRSTWHAPDEYLHRVVVGEPFYLGRAEVTRAEWRAVVGVEDAWALMPRYSPHLHGESEEGFRAAQLDAWGWRTRPLEPGEGALPATGVSPREIDTLFLPAANRWAPPGWEAALPSEAQWEYAARSGSAGPYFGYNPGAPLDVPGWTRENSGLRLHEPGGRGENAWGLVDMHGNAGEIVRDVYAPDFFLSSPTVDPVNDGGGMFRVYRGGSVLQPDSSALSASRHRIHPDNRYEQVGFRVALVKLD